MADDTTALSVDQGTRNLANAQPNDLSVAQDGAPKTTIDKVKGTASDLVDTATQAARTAANQGKDKAGEALDTVTKVVENVATMVEEKVGPTYGKYARNAATGVSDFAESLKSKDVDALVADARDFVRNNPLIAVGLAGAIGFVLTRLVKVGAEEAIGSNA